MNWKAVFLTFGKILLGIFLFLVLVALITLTQVDRSPIAEQDFYRQTMDNLARLPFESSKGENWLAGWGKANVTPSEPVDLVGYAPRGPYEFIQDSSYVKTIVLSNGKQKLAWLNYELLIVHPSLAQSVREKILTEFPDFSQIHFTATHTHSGMGGYMPGLLGSLAFGGFDPKIVDLISERSLLAIKQARSSMDTVMINFKKSDAGLLVANRFVKDGPTDPFVRQLVFTKNSGEKACLLTFSAHATCLSSKFMGLSGDYPFYLMEKMEEREFDFSLFASGTVGSHRPLPVGNTPNAIQAYAHSLDSLVSLKMTRFATVKNPRIKTATLPLRLREPHLRISDEIRIRPWLFNQLLGETKPHIQLTLIGNVLMITSSGEISGVFYEKWENLAKEKGLHLIITTFNGGYMGYITPDELYDENYHEVREMNWYGPGNGYYFDQLIQESIRRIVL
ncbi:neutral/alkaline non-lysosomal ceramidase N-terminal domain-containing protein [Algoriphagus sp.]|uniref:neutral/alkaline non-lysosomal ceramidase N-terminal domain-containing protein n=1 Tax=Algoriphagus sp. TaxID=1872435 RepID=UPI002628AA9B|nr:neutral/alkaline non-lysosomal ceramidase N-terminal domain-containing protein [Algoriphagus sp.]